MESNLQKTMKNKKIILSIVVVALFAVAWIVFINKSSTTRTVSSPKIEEIISFQDINATELLAMLEEKDFTFINVHTPYAGEISGTDSFVSFNQIEKNIRDGKFPSDKDAKIVLYCRSGGMSTIASEELVNMGYTNIINLSGGMIAWEQDGYPIMRLQ